MTWPACPCGRWLTSHDGFESQYIRSQLRCPFPWLALATRGMDVTSASNAAKVSTNDDWRVGIPKPTVKQQCMCLRVEVQTDPDAMHKKRVTWSRRGISDERRRHWALDDQVTTDITEQHGLQRRDHPRERVKLHSVSHVKRRGVRRRQHESVKDATLLNDQDVDKIAEDSLPGEGEETVADDATKGSNTMSLVNRESSRTEKPIEGTKVFEVISRKMTERCNVIKTSKVVVNEETAGEPIARARRVAQELSSFW